MDLEVDPVIQLINEKNLDDGTVSDPSNVLRETDHVVDGNVEWRDRHSYVSVAYTDVAMAVVVARVITDPNVINVSTVT